MPDRLVNEASVKQAVEVLAMVQAWTVSLSLYLSNGGEKWDLKLCTYKNPFGKSSHIYLTTQKYLVYFVTYVSNKEFANFFYKMQGKGTKSTIKLNNVIEIMKQKLQEYVTVWNIVQYICREW